jgi:formate hydrogenlyase subunit 3/multisubunit Na+/H+ antiporter MnhD subunit
MNPSGVGLGLAVAAGVTASAVGMIAPPRWRGRLVGTFVTVAAAAGAAAGVTALGGRSWELYLPNLLSLAGVRLSVDALSGWFLLLVGAVGVTVGVYTLGYVGRGGAGPGSRTAMAILPLFVVSMLLVPAMGDVAGFLLAWELMAITSLLLVMTEHRHGGQVRPAAVWYAVLTQGGFVAVLIGLVWLAALAGSDFAAIRSAAPSLHPALQGGVYLLCLIGFASKAGAVPLHPWLPRAHAEAPSHVSALMSAAMVSFGVYGVLRVGFDLLGGGTAWWWLLLAGLGALSALYGAVQAVVATDLKRLLAFTTAENMGIVLLAVGFGGLFSLAGRPTVAGLAFAAALLHLLNHAAFKTVLFLGAGSVVRATGSRDMDAWGGLSRRMPLTTAAMAAGALSAAALPPGNGFISEWLLLQALLGRADGGLMPAIAAPVGVAVIALTAGVGVATYVKAVGTGLLARPRSAAAAQARESPPSMLAGIGLAVAACLVLAVNPAMTVTAIGHVTDALGVPRAPAAGGAQASLSTVFATWWPAWLALSIAAGTVGVAVLARRRGRGRLRQAAWDCGAGPLTARMEYTATSYAEPLQRVFDDVLAPERDVDVTHDVESAYHIDAIRFRQRIPDRIENRLYRPVIAVLQRLGDAVRPLGSGSVHRYLGYMLAALVVVLVAGVLR